LYRLHGRRLSRLGAIYDTPTLDTWHWLCAVVFQSIFATETDDNNESLLMMLSWEIAWLGKIQQHTPMDGNSHNPHMNVVSPSFKSGTYPVPIVEYLNGIGPVLVGGVLKLPGVPTGNVNKWYNWINGNTGYSSFVWGIPALTWAAITSINLQTTTWNSTWVTNYTAAHTITPTAPLNLGADMMATVRDKIGQGANLDLWGPLVDTLWGTYMCTVRSNCIYTSYTPFPVLAGYSWVKAFYMQEIGSDVPLIGKDLMKAIYFSLYADTNVTTFTEQSAHYWSEDRTPLAQYATLRSYVDKVCRSNQKMQIEFAKYEEANPTMKTLMIGDIEVPATKVGENFVSTFSDKMLEETSIGFPVSDEATSYFTKNSGYYAAAGAGSVVTLAQAYQWYNRIMRGLRGRNAEQADWADMQEMIYMG